MQVFPRNFAIFAEIHLHIMKLCKIIITILALVTTLVGSAQNLTIEWSAESAHLVTRGGYARIKRIDDRHALVYETRGAV